MKSPNVDTRKGRKDCWGCDNKVTTSKCNCSYYGRAKSKTDARKEIEASAEIT